MYRELNALNIGDSVYLNINGVKTEFFVVHQGLPSDSLYDSSCEGTWLLMKGSYFSGVVWSDSNNGYDSSNIHSYLNETFLGMFDNSIQTAIKEVKIPYGNSSGSYLTGSSGLTAKIFLLSECEVGDSIATDGALLDYFNVDADSILATRICYREGNATNWFLRSPMRDMPGYIRGITPSGEYGVFEINSARGVRPALILDSSLFMSDEGYVFTHIPPPSPSEVIVPYTAMGGESLTFAWKWERGPDYNGDLESYIAELSTDGGSSWTVIYMGKQNNATDFIPFGTSTVIYRVKALGSEGEYSDYAVSSQITVINNIAPSAPILITVPIDVAVDRPLSISWSVSTDDDYNLSGYKLERQIDGGDWTEIYCGKHTDYIDNIQRGWSTVAYRVKAYDPYSESNYTTSATRAVDNNIPPKITCNNFLPSTDLGMKSSGFSIAYSVSDEEGDVITVTETLDGIVKRTFTATDGATNNFAVTGEYFQKLLNGVHEIEISATDGNRTTVYPLAFTKKVNTAAITLKEPMEADDAISMCAISVSGNIPFDGDYTVEVTNNAKDDVPVWEDCTVASKRGTNYLFSNDTANNGFAFNFRVTAKRGSSEEVGYITSVQGGFQ